MTLWACPPACAAYIPVGWAIERGASCAETRFIIEVCGTKLIWREGTIKELVSDEIVQQNSMKESVKLEKFFTARHLERIAGV